MSSTTASPRSLTTSARPFTCTSSFSTRSHLDWSSSSAAVSGAWSESPTSSPTPSPSSRVAGRITDLYLCIAQRGPAYRGYDPDDSEGETMDDFLGWCVRRARGHEAAVLGGKRSAHKRALLGLNARKEYRRAMCGKISELRQRYVGCAHAGSQFHAAHYRERLQAAAAMLNDLEGTPVFASLDEEVEVHEDITLRLQRRIEDSQKELEEPRMASDWGNRKKAR